MLVESRRVRERRLRPQAGCHVQRLLCYPVNAAAAIRLCYQGAPAALLVGKAAQSYSRTAATAFALEHSLI